MYSSSIKFQSGNTGLIWNNFNSEGMSDDNRKEPLPALPLMLKSESRSEIVQKKIIVQKESNEHENYENDGKKDHNFKGGLPL